MNRTQRLLDIAPQPHQAWTGSVALVPIGQNCPHGHGPLTTTTAAQGVLFRHGGAGAPVESTWLICLTCHWSILAVTVEINPKRWAA